MKTLLLILIMFMSLIGFSDIIDPPGVIISKEFSFENLSKEQFRKDLLKTIPPKVSPSCRKTNIIKTGAVVAGLGFSTLLILNYVANDDDNRNDSEPATFAILLSTNIILCTYIYLSH